MKALVNRRDLLTGAAASAAVAAVGVNATRASADEQAASAVPAGLGLGLGSGSPALYERWPTRSYFSFSLLRAYMQIRAGGATFAEVTGAANRIGDVPSSEAWVREFVAVGDAAGHAATRLRGDDRWLSAEASLREATYLRSAEFFVDPLSQRSAKIAMYRRSRAAFERWAAVQDEEIKTVSVPYGKHGLESVLVRGRGVSRRHPGPAVIVFGGLDSIGEELVTGFGLRDLARAGVTVLAVDGPGCGATLRLHDTKSRPDYEVAAAAAVDYLEGRHDVDARRIGLMGVSLGGYYAIRSAAFERRLRCCVAWGAVWDVLAAATIPSPDPEPDITTFKLRQGQWVFGGKDLAETAKRVARYKLDGVAQRVKAPTLVLHGGSDRLAPVEQARTLDRALRAPHQMVIFPAGTPGETHCQVDSPTTAIARWLPFLTHHLRAARA